MTRALSRSPGRCSPGWIQPPTGRHDEAAGIALEAVTSGRLVPSNYWRAREVIDTVSERGVPEARELAEAFREICTASDPPALP